MVPALIGAARVGPGGRALDLCCGHGIISDAMVQAGAQVVGVDFSEPMLAMARKRAPGAEFRQGDAMALDLDEAQFDAATIGFGVPHVPDPPRVFAEVRRVLKPGGWLAYSVWSDVPDSAMAYVFTAIADHGEPGIALPPGPGASDYADPARASSALTAAGFDAPTLATVDSFWQVDDPGAPFDFFDAGTVRGGALLRVQSPAFRAAIRGAVVDRVRAVHGPKGPWKVPIPAVVVAAQAI